MGLKKLKKKRIGLNNFGEIVKKNLDLEKIKINPVEILQGTKNKIGNFYENIKKEREKERKRSAKRKQIEKKKE